MVERRAFALVPVLLLGLSAAASACAGRSESSYEPMPAREEWADEERCEEIGNLAESCRGLGDVRRRPTSGGHGAGAEGSDTWMPDVSGGPDASTGPAPADDGPPPDPEPEDD